MDKKIVKFTEGCY